VERPEPHCGRKTQVLLSRLTHVKATPKGWSAYCPVHENDGARHKPSLHVREGEKWINMECWSGCGYWDIVAALGLKSEDVALQDDQPYDPSLPKPKRPAPGKRELELEAKFAAQLLQREPEILARLRNERGWAAAVLDKFGVGWLTLEKRLSLPTYDKDGQFHAIERYDPFGVHKRKTLATTGKSRTLWPAPEMLQPNGELHVVEGGGTALSMASIGLTAVSLPGGMPQPRGSADNPGKFSGSGWHKSWGARLATHHKVIFWPDCDTTGRDLMTVASTDTQNAGARVIVVELRGPDKFDVGDMLRYARNLELRKEARVVIQVLVECAKRRQWVQGEEFWKGWYGKFNGNAASL
jgi:hypothetical protein